MESSRSHQIRIAAMDWLNSMINRYPDYVFPSSVLMHEFYFGNEHVVLSGQQGIWKPRQMDFPITIKSMIDSIYDDEFISGSQIRYRYKGTNPDDWSNRGLRNCMNYGIPLIYLHEVARGRYIVQWPVFIVGDNPDQLSFIVEADNRQYALPADVENLIEEPIEIEREYATRLMVQRLHQGTFREQVLQAYKEHCAVCKLKHRELLDAAHIIPDNKGGKAEVPNGLSLCKIHHAAFDRYILGVTPDYKIEIREDILHEIDGPMLKHGLQEMHGSKIILPRNTSLQPNREYLEERYGVFRSAG